MTRAWAGTKKNILVHDKNRTHDHPNTGQAGATSTELRELMESKII